MTAATLPRDAVPVEIGGHRLWLRYSLGTLAHLQAILGLKSWAAVVDVLHELEPRPEDGGDVEAWMRRVSPSHLEVVLWCGLIECMGQGQERVFASPDALGRAVGLRDLARLLQAVAVAIAVQFNPPEAEEGAEDPTANPPTAAAVRSA